MRAEGFAKCAEDYKDQKPGDENQIRVCRLGDPPLCLGLGDDRGWERSSNRLATDAGSSLRFCKVDSISATQQKIE